MTVIAKACLAAMLAFAPMALAGCSEQDSAQPTQPEGQEAPSPDVPEGAQDAEPALQDKEEEDADGPKAISFSEAVGSEKFQFAISDSMWWPKSDEYFSFADTDTATYRAEEGKALLLFTGTFKNLGGEEYDVNKSIEVEAVLNGKYAYPGWADVLAPDGRTKQKILPLEEARFIIGIPVPLEAYETFSSADVELKAFDAHFNEDGYYTTTLDVLGDYLLHFE